MGTIYSMRVGNNGSFSGEGYGMSGEYYRLSGSLSGAAGTYSVSAPGMGMTLSGRISWDRQCHLMYQTFDPSGTTVVAQGQMHVNHEPGEPCP